MPTNELIQIVNAAIIPNEEALLTYSANVVADDFTAADFVSNPSGALGIGVTQAGPTELQIVFNQSIVADASVTYTDATPGVLTPQTILYT